jgi:hypothetical protein
MCAQCSTVPYLLCCGQCSTVPSSLPLLYAQFSTVPLHYCSVHNKVLCPHYYLCTRTLSWASWSCLLLLCNISYDQNCIFYVQIHMYKCSSSLQWLLQFELQDMGNITVWLMPISLFYCRMSPLDYSGSPYSGKCRLVSLFGQLSELSLTVS